MFLLLVFLLQLFLSVLSAEQSNSQAFTPTTPAHCECTCCTRTHLHTTCSPIIYKVPLTAGHLCDARIYSSSDPQTCGPALCRHHFALQCPSPPSFFRHACVSDRGFISDWAPLAFVTIALLTLFFVMFLILRTSTQRQEEDEEKQIIQNLNQQNQPTQLVTNPLIQTTGSSNTAYYDPAFINHHATWSPSSTYTTRLANISPSHGRTSSYTRPASMSSLPPLPPPSPANHSRSSFMTIPSRNIISNYRTPKHVRSGSLPNVNPV